MRTDAEFLREVLRRRDEGLKKQKKRRCALRVVGGVLCFLLLMLPAAALIRVPTVPGYAELTRSDAIGLLGLVRVGEKPEERTDLPDLPKKGDQTRGEQNGIESTESIDTPSGYAGTETAAPMESLPHEAPEKPAVPLFSLLFGKEARKKAADEAAERRLLTLLSSLPLLLPRDPEGAETLTFSCGADGVLCEEVTVSGRTLRIRYEAREAAGGLYAEGIVLGQEAKFYLSGGDALLLLGSACPVCVTFPADGSPIEWKQMLEALFYLRAPTEILTK